MFFMIYAIIIRYRNNNYRIRMYIYNLGRFGKSTRKLKRIARSRLISKSPRVHSRRRLLYSIAASGGAARLQGSRAARRLRAHKKGPSLGRRRRRRRVRVYTMHIKDIIATAQNYI